MNILLVIEGDEAKETTFSILCIKNEALLLHFSPEFHLHSLNWGEVYHENGVEALKKIFESDFGLAIDGYVIVTIDNLLLLLQLFLPEGFEEELKALSNSLDTKISIRKCLTYTSCIEDDFSVYVYQNHLFNLLKIRVLKKRNLLRILSLTKQISNYVETDIDNGRWSRLIVRYIGKTEIPVDRFIFPLANTFRVIKRGSDTSIRMVDIGTNERFLRDILNEQLLKES